MLVKSVATCCIYTMHAMWPKVRAYFDIVFETALHTYSTALFLGIPVWAGTRKVKPIWILLKQETMASAGPYARLHLVPDR